MQPVTRLRGMYDLSRESWLRQRELQDALTGLISRYGYQRRETPILEATELFLRKSGGDLASRMYSFVDGGGNAVSLRPEFTSPLMRCYLEQAGALAWPVRWQYAGPVFRCEAHRPESSGQFTQVGAELLGSGSVMADAELLTLAAQVPQHIGISGCRIALADLDVLQSVLDTTGVSDRARTFIIGNVPQLRRGRAALPEIAARAAQLNLGDRSPENRELSAALVGLADDQARQVIQGFLQWNGADRRRFGQRDPEQIVDRFLRKLRGSDEPARLERGLALAADLAALRGPPAQVLPAARQVGEKAGADPSALNRLAELLAILAAAPEVADTLTLDFSLARGLAYYNGIVFEVNHPEGTEPLGGGGRYDGLARALGSPQEVPALGFAYTLENLLALTQPATAGRRESPDPTLVVAADSESRLPAFQAARELRQAGVPVELEVCGRDLAASLSYAAGRGLKSVLLIHSDGAQTPYDVA